MGDSIDEEHLIAAAATTLPREELPEAMAELRNSQETRRRGDAGVVSSAELQELEQRLSTSRLLTLVTTLIAGFCLTATVLIVLDVTKDLGLGLGRKLQGQSAQPSPELTAPVDNLSTPVAPPTASEPTQPPSTETEAQRPRTRGIAGSSSQPAVLPSSPPPATTPGPHDKPTPDGEKIPPDSRWDEVASLLKKSDRESIIKALTLVETLEHDKVPPPASRPDLGRAVRTKAALMTLTPASPPESPK